MKINRIFAIKGITKPKGAKKQLRTDMINVKEFDFKKYVAELTDEELVGEKICDPVSHIPEFLLISTEVNGYRTN